MLAGVASLYSALTPGRLPSFISLLLMCRLRRTCRRRAPARLCGGSCGRWRRTRYGAPFAADCDFVVLLQGSSRVYDWRPRLASATSVHRRRLLTPRARIHSLTAWRPRRHIDVDGPLCCRRHHCAARGAHQQVNVTGSSRCSGRHTQPRPESKALVTFHLQLKKQQKRARSSCPLLLGRPPLIPSPSPLYAHTHTHSHTHTLVSLCVWHALSGPLVCC